MERKKCNIMECNGKIFTFSVKNIKKRKKYKLNLWKWLNERRAVC